MVKCCLYVENHTSCFVSKFYNSFIVGHSKHLGLQYHQIWSPPYQIYHSVAELPHNLKKKIKHEDARREKDWTQTQEEMTRGKPSQLTSYISTAKTLHRSL